MEFEGAHEEIVWRSNEVIGRWVGDRRASLKTYRCAKSDASSPFTTWVRVTGWQDDSARVGVRTGVMVCAVLFSLTAWAMEYAMCGMSSSAVTASLSAEPPVCCCVNFAAISTTLSQAATSASSFDEGHAARFIVCQQPSGPG